MVYENASILVTGATGNVGRLVVDSLLALGARNVRALTVNPSRAALPPSVGVFTGYLGRPSSLLAALDGVDLMYLAPKVETCDEVCRMAAGAGVRHIVDLAGVTGSPWEAVERAVEASGIPWTHLEAGEFMTNTQMWAPQIKTGDLVRDHAGESATAVIALEDIADVAARVLLDGGHPGRSYELTGPASVTRCSLVTQIGAALGRELRYLDLPLAEAIAYYAPTMGADNADWYFRDRPLLAEHPQTPLTTVADVLGRPATTFAEWARDHVDLFRPAENARR
ncbi:NAD(P)H-binding protein [Actinoplanes sp. NBRC 103695]|uniref:NAD(P)H-binding protein n=1 Tax=Actinoplanes sp. NBRC 103695 TaxID=3032202 RepID=UPI0024A05178|nr:NAD(P)H-binding protein [Actinoplanes sp. NBRC 103695]GLY94559.1 nucleotide-diphosphate-sugar epimerase [Actinoplanes sp. NBRC 103695]